MFDQYWVGGEWDRERERGRELAEAKDEAVKVFRDFFLPLPLYFPVFLYFIITPTLHWEEKKMKMKKKKKVLGKNKGSNLHFVRWKQIQEGLGSTAYSCTDDYEEPNADDVNEC